MWIHRLNKYIAWSFYCLFFLVPIVMFPTTYELFEFNKMWLTFGVGLLILFFWIAKMTIAGKIIIRRTPLDIPILLFLASQIISTIFSLDPHISWWGYYSRFNGGLLSTITYVFLYYAFASNLTDGEYAGKASYKILLTSVFSGIFVTLWGLPSHFGADPTCLLFRGSFDVSCWTDAFHPTIREFSTLGQPNWLAAFVSVTIPITVACAIRNVKPFHIGKVIFYLTFAILMYYALLWTRSQSGFAGFWIGFIVFIVLTFWSFLPGERKTISDILKLKSFRTLSIAVVIILVITFFEGTPISKLYLLTWPGLSSHFSQPSSSTTNSGSKTPVASPSQPPPQVGELGGTDSSKIRLIVWQGAIDIFKRYPLFGSGVETFAFAYYAVRPAAHNLTSEWDYLYNKAHNEYLNYLATTGIFGLGTYLIFIGLFFFYALKRLLFHSQHEKNPDHQSSLIEQSFGPALLGALLSMLISNFFGFSVVIVNLFIFLIPVFFFDLYNMFPDRYVFGYIPNEHHDKQKMHTQNDISTGKVFLLLLVFVVIAYFEYLLLRFWQADIHYALGYNLDHANEYIQAEPELARAVEMRPGEDVFKDEYAVNLSTLALIAAQENQGTQAAQFAEQAKQLSDEVVANHPNNILYYKDRTRIFYALAQLNKTVLPQALDAINHAHALAPTDAKILYNEALIYQQMGDSQKALDLFSQTLQLRPNYNEAVYAEALMYEQLSKNEKDVTKKEEYHQKAIDLAKSYLQTYDPNDSHIKELLKSL